MNFKDLVKQYTNYDLSDYQLSQFETYYEFLIEYNKKVNLTRIVEKEDVYIKHFLDSILPITQIDLKQVYSLIDMGSGAGFPGIPLKILYPHLEVTLVDARKKKLVFLDQLIEKLALNNVITKHERLESINPNHQYDLATARALSTLEQVLEYAYPLIKSNGHILSYKAISYQEDLENLSKVWKNKINITSIVESELPQNSGIRYNILIFKK